MYIVYNILLFYEILYGDSIAHTHLRAALYRHTHKHTHTQNYTQHTYIIYKERENIFTHILCGNIIFITSLNCL